MNQVRWLVRPLSVIHCPLSVIFLLLCSHFSFANPDSLATEIFAHKKLIVKNIEATAEQQAWLSEADVNLNRYVGKNANQEMMSGVLQKFIAHCENNGYPFARAQLDSIQVDSNYFCAKLKLEKGRYVSIDSLVVKSDGSVRLRFMQNHLGLRRPRAYSERYVQSVDQRINELGFLTTLQPSAMLFGESSAQLYTYVERAKSNRANGLLAFGTDENGKLQLRGEAGVFIANLFKNGEELSLAWQSPDKNVQLLNVGVKLPYLIFGTVGVAAQLDMERRDTLYMSLHSKLGLLSRVGSYGSATLFIDLQRHSNTATNSSTNAQLYGAEYTLSRLNSVLFPRSGVSAHMSLAAGTRKAQGGSASAEVEGAASIAGYAAMGNRANVLLRAVGKIRNVFDSATLLPSELYSIGGASTLRGFNERSIFTSAYAVATVEPQFYFSAQGYLSAFCDYALAKNEHATSRTADHFLSLGVGTRFATGAGIFSLSYALGKTNGNGFLLKNAKVHVGYTVVF